MNKIVREHYPVEKLPEDLRAELAGQSTVTVTIEAEAEQSAATGRPASSIVEVLKRARHLREAGVIKPVSSEEAVDRIRKLRDEWDS